MFFHGIDSILETVDEVATSLLQLPEEEQEKRLIHLLQDCTTMFDDTVDKPFSGKQGQ